MDSSQNNWHAYDPNGNQAPPSTRRAVRAPAQRPKIHCCDLCDRAFDRPSALSQHMLTHTGERPHLCQLCQQRRFATASNLYRHMRTCRAAPPNQSEGVETDLSAEDTDEEAINPAAVGSTIGQIIPAGGSAPTTPSNGYDRRVAQGANSDQLFERPLSYPSDPAIDSHQYQNTPPPPRSASTSWLGRDVREEGQQAYIPHHAYTTPPGPLPQTYVPRVDAAQQPQAMPPTYNEPAFGLPNAEHATPPYPVAQYDPTSFAQSGIAPVQSYARAETFPTQPVPYPYGPSTATPQIPYSTQHEQFYSGGGHQQLSEQQQQVRQQNIAPEEGWQGPSGRGGGDVRYYHQSG